MNFRKKRIYTVDPPRQLIRSRDAMLTPPTTAELAANQRRTAAMTGLNLGLRWVGDLQPVGAAVAEVIDAVRRMKDKGSARDAVSMATVALASFGSELDTSEAGEGPFGSLNFQGNDEAVGGREEDIAGHAVRSNDGGRFTGDFASTGTPEDLNAMYKEHWARRGTQDVAAPQRGERPTPQQINAANRAFWATQKPAAVMGRPYGKG